MKYISLFEEFGKSTILDLNEVNRFMNSDGFAFISKTYQQLPQSIKNKVYDYISNQKIDINEIQNTVQKYNLTSKVKDILQKGVSEIKDIYNKIFNKQNESVFWGVVLIIVGIIALLSEKKGCANFIAAVICLVFAAQQCSKEEEPVETETETIESLVTFKTDTGDVDLYLTKDESGNWIVKKLN